MADFDEPSSVVMERLRALLQDRKGKLRASDALRLAGFKSSSYRRAQLVASTLRALGWERGRYRFQGKLLYAYARGSPLERETMLEVEDAVDDGFVVKSREP